MTKNSVGFENDYVKVISSKRNPKNNYIIYTCICKRCNNVFDTQYVYEHKYHNRFCPQCMKLLRKKPGPKMKSNQFEEHDDYYIMYSAIQNIPYIIDKEYYELCKGYRWYTDADGYAVSSKDNEKVTLHRLIMGCSNGDGKIVDHINQNKQDNRKSNLRFVSCKENNLNRDYLKYLRSNAVWMNDGYKQKHVSQDDIPHYEQLGWKLGTVQGTLWINNGIQCKRVTQSELSRYIQNGWKRGRKCSC